MIFLLPVFKDIFVEKHFLYGIILAEIKSYFNLNSYKHMLLFVVNNKPVVLILKFGVSLVACKIKHFLVSFILFSNETYFMFLASNI